MQLFETSSDFFPCSKLAISLLTITVSISAGTILEFELPKKIMRQGIKSIWRGETHKVCLAGIMEGVLAGGHLHPLNRGILG